VKIIAASLALGLVTVLPGPVAAAPAPAHRLDVTIKLKGGEWVGTGVYGAPRRQQVVGVLRKTPGRVVAVVKVTNTGTRDTDLDLWASSIRTVFYGGAHWPDEDSLAPGESVTFRYVGHRGSAEPGDSMPVDITVRDGRRVLDGVRLLLRAR
jgi:hypothetical protein